MTVSTGTKQGATQSPIVAGTRPGKCFNFSYTLMSRVTFDVLAAVSSSVPVGGGGASANSRTYLVTTQAPPSTMIPVAKVLPQPVVCTATATSAFRSKELVIRFLDQHVFYCTLILQVLVQRLAIYPVSLRQTKLRWERQRHRAVPLDCTYIQLLAHLQVFSFLAFNDYGIFNHCNHFLANTENTGIPVTYSAAQPNTPSKLIGTSPRPSILRKRDYEG